MELDTIRRVLTALEREGVRHVVFGDVALNLLGLARATEDLDLFIEPTADDVLRLEVALASVFADPSIEEITAADLLGDHPAIQHVPPEGSFRIDLLTRLGEAFRLGDHPAIQYVPPEDSFRIDLLTRLGEAFRFEALESQTADLEGVSARVVTPRTSYRMKRDTVRLQDRADAAALRERFRLEDE